MEENDEKAEGIGQQAAVQDLQGRQLLVVDLSASRALSISFPQEPTQPEGHEPRDDPSGHARYHRKSNRELPLLPESRT